MNDLEQLTRATVTKLAAKRNGVVVAAIAGDTVEIQGSGGLGADTRFEIGSITKVFTALALAKLTVAGVTSLDEPLRDLLPAGTTVPTRDGQEITLRHLATHTSGLSRLPTGMLLGAILRPRQPDPYAHCTREYLLGALGRAKLGAAPGRRFRYSNFGAGLLGLALANRAGLSYDALISREISTPLGLLGTSTGGDTTQGHRANGRPEAPWQLVDLAGAGGLRSTPADVVTFVRAHLSPGGELAPAIRLAAETEHRVNPFLTVRLGWMAQRLHAKQGGHLQVFHNGGTGGFSSIAAYDPDTNVGVVALSDTQRSVDAPAFELLKALQSGA
ncbi:serine hydrolase domain-containing protein [Actinoplanes aureus]|uniref:Beta-lactamase family protein n=1 Tax=Actinoplanes aureus TaxID=2792083 RepID=A0A931G174_9ACTN|nr:serine hydrolase domain-containing protein [Actinoplanes aureus]MBG0564841.1 beta-lactamase family protein [Actinoplanes aureus]